MQITKKALTDRSNRPVTAKTIAEQECERMVRDVLPITLEVRFCEVGQTLVEPTATKRQIPLQGQVLNDELRHGATNRPEANPSGERALQLLAYKFNILFGDVRMQR